MVSARSDGAQNGAYTGVTLGQPGIGDGRTAPLFDGANDYNNIYTVALAGAFNGAEGTLMMWHRVSAAGVWADGSLDVGIYLRANGNNQVYFQKLVAVNTFEIKYVAGGVGITRNPITSTTAWFQVAITWSALANIAQAYFNGIPFGLPGAVGVWAGALSVGNTRIGAFDAVPNFPWNGLLAHCAVWARPLVAAEVAALAVV